MTEKGCDNCYYTCFDEKAYPCSLCIRGVERTDMWQPSKKTKADHKDEPQTDCETCKHKHDGMGYCKTCGESNFEPKDEPTTQTETQKSNLTFEKRTMRDCYNCKRYETEGECIECNFEPKDEPQERGE